MSMEETEACGKQCACRTHQINRREALALSGAVVMGSVLGGMPVMAGPLGQADPAQPPPTDFAALIPPDKKLRPEWVQSLFARGVPTVYTKKRDELRFIGMPVGGICCGTVYLGGDGRLWNWDIFNENPEGVLPRNVPWDGFGVAREVTPRDGAAYVAPHEQQSPFEQGFALKVGGKIFPFSAQGWADITFRGAYPLGTVTYTDPASPVSVTMTAYSPFIPLQADDSGLPVTLCEFTVTNTSHAPVKAEIAGWLQNAARIHSGAGMDGVRANAVRPVTGATVMECRFNAAAPLTGGTRPDMVVADFEHEDYGLWTTTGTAFGNGPVRKTDAPAYQGDLGGVGDYVVNSHASAPGTDTATRDAATGTLTSPLFTIDRRFLAFDIGGGSDIEQVGLAVIIDGKTVRRAAGRDDNHMQRTALDVSEFAGKQATIQIYDHGTGAWGNIGISHIVQTDQSPAAVTGAASPTDGDAGTMALMLLGSGTAKADATPETVFDAPASDTAQGAAESPLFAAITHPLSLALGQSQTVTYAITWHFPNSRLKVKDAAEGNYYAKRFGDAAAVAEHVAANYPRLSRQTKLWHDTWYDSTLPYWFLDRSLVNISILATSTAHRFGTGRFWGWEGIGCCPGTCTHVWQYAQAMSRLFPELERDVRERVDLGIALHSDGVIGFRGEGSGPAVDGQCGRILGTYREHQMSADDKFLRRVWPNAKRALQYMINHDSDGDGLLDGPQPNTLDGTWYGGIPWLSSLYAAALRAGEEMATEMGDADFAAVCRQKFDVSKAALETKLFDGEYFIQLPDPAHTDALGAYRGCHVDQVMGQGWAWQVNLGRILDRDKTVTALKSLYKYNFAPDVGRFRAKNTAGRPYALAGDGGLIVVTNPRELPNPFGVQGWQFQYFNECQSGYEHQAAGHMIAEGLVLEGLAVTRAIHDRYHAARRNPYNEIECSDHYSRAMASYGSFISLCGFEHHGPKGHIGFAPRLTPHDFRAPFTAAEGWGAFSQKIIDSKLSASITLKHGALRLRTIALEAAEKSTPRAAAVSVNGKHTPASLSLTDRRALVTLHADVKISQGESMEIVLS